jgi:NitT/TauT family transport system permease protein
LFEYDVGTPEMIRSIFRSLVIWSISGATFLFLWQLLLSNQWVNPDLVPSVGGVLSSAEKILTSAVFHKHLYATLEHLALGFFIAVPAGVAIGILIAESRYWGQVFKPIIYLVFSIPKTVFLPMFILAFGIGLFQKVAFGIFSTIFINLICTFAAVDSVKSEHLKVARVFGASRLQIALRVYLPSMAPILLEAVRLGMIFNVTGIILAEMYASKVGLGQMIANWGENFMLKELGAGILIISVATILFNETIQWFEMKFEHWRE